MHAKGLHCVWHGVVPWLRVATMLCSFIAWGIDTLTTAFSLGICEELFRIVQGEHDWNKVPFKMHSINTTCKLKLQIHKTMLWKLFGVNCQI